MNDLFDLLVDRDNGSRPMYGVAVGKVAEIRDPLNIGRVKVVFPWMDDDDTDTVVIDENDRRAHSYWARVATLMAGKNRGSYFLPQPGDEVLVAFEHGELDRPVVIGMLWNEDERPPVTMDDDGRNVVHGIYTRSKHKIEFNDSDDKAQILIIDKTGKNQILIDTANRRLQIEMDGDITIKATGSIEISANQDITLSAKNNVTIKATNNFEAEAQNAATVKGTASAKLEGTTQAEVSGAMVNVKGSAVTNIQGGLVKIN
jgi:uncharacterized protein involved in type VI secretion and phage assembly